MSKGNPDLAKTEHVIVVFKLLRSPNFTFLILQILTSSKFIEALSTPSMNHSNSKY